MRKVKYCLVGPQGLEPITGEFAFTIWEKRWIGRAEQVPSFKALNSTCARFWSHSQSKLWLYRITPCVDQWQSTCGVNQYRSQTHSTLFTPKKLAEALVAEAWADSLIDSSLFQNHHPVYKAYLLTTISSTVSFVPTLYGLAGSRVPCRCCRQPPYRYHLCYSYLLPTFWVSISYMDLSVRAPKLLWSVWDGTWLRAPRNHINSTFWINRTCGACSA